MMTPTWHIRPDASGMGPDPGRFDELDAEQVRERAIQDWSETGSGDPAIDQDYARFESVPLVFVELEAADTSPFMDS